MTEENISYYDFNTKQREWISKYKAIPLFTECQLRQFIQDKTNGSPEFTKSFLKNNYDIEIYAYDKEFENEYSFREFYDIGDTLLQAYWNVAIEIAKEEI